VAETETPFYDAFADHYHLMFEDWEASMRRQAAALSSLLRRECRSACNIILDCACGIGTQSLGLAELGFRVTGSDANTGAIRRAFGEAKSRGLRLDFQVADMRKLEDLPIADVDRQAASHFPLGGVSSAIPRLAFSLILFAPSWKKPPLPLLATVIYKTTDRAYLVDGLCQTRPDCSTTSNDNGIAMSRSADLTPLATSHSDPRSPPAVPAHSSLSG
jgi:SAM-dependent methyltransferase